jgi:hypothetical protein
MSGLLGKRVRKVAADRKVGAGQRVVAIEIVAGIVAVEAGIATATVGIVRRKLRLLLR